MIYYKEDKDNLYFQCDKCNEIIPVDKLFLKSDENGFIHLHARINCKCGNTDKTKVFDKSLSSEVKPVEKVACPICGSQQITVQKRGWTWTTAFIAMNKNKRVCMNCLHKW